MANSEVAVSAVEITPATLTLRSAAGAAAPGIEISLNIPRGDRGNDWSARATIASDDSLAGVIAAADERVLRIALPSTANARTLGFLHDAIEAIHADSNGDPFDAAVSYEDGGAAATVISLTVAAFTPSASSDFSGGVTEHSPPVDLITEAGLTVGDEYRLQAQAEGAIHITEQLSSSGTPDTSNVPAFILPDANHGEFLIEPEANKTIWVYAVGGDGVVAVNG